MSDEHPTPEPASAARPEPEADEAEATPPQADLPEALASKPLPPIPSWRKDKTKSLARRAPPGDHVALHATVGRAAAGAGLGALLADGLTWAFGTGLWESPVLAVCVLGGALAAVAARGKRWWRALLGAGAGAVGAGLFVATASLWPPFAALLMGLAAAPVLAEGQPRGRQAFTAVLAGLLGSAGLFVARVMLGWEVFDGVVPSLLGHAAAGASAGLFIGLSAAPKYLGRPPDPVEAAYHGPLGIKDGEVHEILARTIEIHRSLKADLAARDELEAMAKVADREQELVLRILHIASECRQIRTDLDATPAEQIRARADDLSGRAASAKDAGARRTYEQAVSSLEEQLEALERIEDGRERVVARLHATVALLEKLRFALIHLRSADAERIGGELPLVTEALDALTDELEATSSAVGEVYGGARRIPATEGAQVLALPGATGTDDT